jgi:hypothetical protein
MTYQDDCTLPSELKEQLTEQSFVGLHRMIRVLVDETLHFEMQNYLSTMLNEQTEGHRGTLMRTSLID